MTPLQAYRESVAAILSDYDRDEISFEEALTHAEAAAFTCREGLMFELSDEVRDAFFDTYSTIQLKALAKGHTNREDAELGMKFYAETLFEQNEEVVASHMRPVEAEMIMADLDFSL